MSWPLKDEALIRKALAFYQSERKNCDETNAFVGACMELLKLERKRAKARNK